LPLIFAELQLILQRFALLTLLLPPAVALFADRGK